MYTYQQAMNDVLIPEITETLWKKDYDWLKAIFTPMPASWDKGGEQIEKQMRVAATSTARNYDRTDTYGESGDTTIVTAKWNKIYTDVVWEVHGIDISQAKNGGITTIADLMRDAIVQAYGDLKAKLFENLYSMLRADIDSTSTYSDAALSRSTYTRLASYEEGTDTAITLALLRAARNAVTLNETVSDDQYIWLMEQAVFNVFNPLAAALHTWNTEGMKGREYAAGYQPVGSWEGSDVTKMPGMTTGDVFYVRPQDVYVHEHRSLESDSIESGKDSIKGVMKIGVHLLVDNPGLQGKMTDKD